MEAKGSAGRQVNKLGVRRFEHSLQVAGEGLKTEIHTIGSAAEEFRFACRIVVNVADVGPLEEPRELFEGPASPCRNFVLRHVMAAFGNANRNPFGLQPGGIEDDIDDPDLEALPARPLDESPVFGDESTVSTPIV